MTIRVETIHMRAPEKFQRITSDVEINLADGRSITIEPASITFTPPDSEIPALIERLRRRREQAVRQIAEVLNVPSDIYTD